MFALILADTVNKAMLTSKRKAFKKAATKDIFAAVLDELKITFMEEPFKSLNDKVLKGKESINMGIKRKLQRKYKNSKQLWRKFIHKKKKSGHSPVQPLFCIFEYFLNFALPHSYISPYETRGAASSLYFYLKKEKKSLNCHKTQLLVIYVCVVFVLKTNFCLSCFTQIKKLFFANFLSIFL